MANTICKAVMSGNVKREVAEIYVPMESAIVDGLTVIFRLENVPLTVLAVSVYHRKRETSIRVLSLPGAKALMVICYVCPEVPWIKNVILKIQMHARKQDAISHLRIQGA